MGVIRLLVVDDHPVVRRGIQGMLSLEKDICVVGDAGSGAEAIRQVAELHPDVVLMDIMMPGLDGTAATQQIRQSFPETSVLVMTSFEDEDLLLRALQAGARGYLLKNVAQNELVEAIKAIHRGARMVSPELVDKVLKDYESLTRERARDSLGLTEQELRILSLLAEGLATKEISARMFFSEVTVKRKLQDIYRKLGATDRAQAVALAIKRGLI